MAAGAAVASHTVLVVTAGLLFWIAATDLREFKIRNELILVLAGLFFLHAALSGRWVELHWNLGFAAAIGVLMLIAYAQGLMGGGDVKLLAVAFLWTGLRCAVPFLLVLAAVSLLHWFAAERGWVAAQRTNGRLRVPFAPAIAAGLIAVFLMGCLAPTQRAGGLLPHLWMPWQNGHFHGDDFQPRPAAAGSLYGRT
jgi:prepilin peptidase CpaA